ncbi:MAG: Flp family type IVb pilin [Alphaproteobacteria bacterium]
MQNLVTRFIKDESGATAIEYGLMAALIGVAIIGGARLLGQSLNNQFTSVAGSMTTT